MKMLSLLRSYGNAAAKGIIIYANNNTIWNQIAMLEDANGRSYLQMRLPMIRRFRVESSARL